jgi:HK97 gp10 family phage protein
MEVITRMAGLQDLRHDFARLERSVRQKTSRSAVRKAANILRNECELQAELFFSKGYVTGNLASSIVARVAKRQDGLEYNSVGYKVGVLPRAFYWRFLEFGTRHIVAKPFMRTAYEKSRERVGAAVVRNLKTDPVLARNSGKRATGAHGYKLIK